MDSEDHDVGQCKYYNCKNPGLPEHTCPYSEDIHGDTKSLCNCCTSCQNQCAADI